MTAAAADTYLSFILTRPTSEVWSLFLLSLGRIVPAIALSPFLGGKALADPMKIGFGVAIAIIFLPFLLASTPDGVSSFNVLYMLLMVKEIFVGATMGFLLSIPFYIAQSAGNLIDHQRGTESLQVTDPITQTQVTATGTLFGNLMLVVFFAIGGAFFFFDALFTSYTLIPPTHWLGPQFFQVDRPLWVLMIDLANFILKITLQLSAPALIAMLLADLFLGIANRMAPQVQITFLLYSLKSFMGIGMLWIGWWWLLKQLDVETLSWLNLFKKIVSTF